jgi:ParB/RepB/Spo0J family partition protein
VKISVITANPTNDEIYDKTDLSSLVGSIDQNGLLEPIVVTKTGTIISGHRRFAAVKELGWEDVDVRIVDVENEVIALIEHNRYRTKSEKDVLRESRFLEKELRTQIGRGRNATKNREGKNLKLDLELAKRLNVGTTKLKQLRSIENYQLDFPDFTRHFLAWKNSPLQTAPEKHLQCDYVV